MKRTALIGFLVFTMLIMTLPADAHRGGHGDQGLQRVHPLLTMNWNRVETIATEIQMTQDQIGELQDLRSQFRTRVEPLKTDLRILNQELRDLIQSDDQSSENSALDLAETLNAKQKELMLLNIRNHYKIQALLTESQKQELRKMVQDRHRERKHQRANRRARSSGTGRGKNFENPESNRW